MIIAHTEPIFALPARLLLLSVALAACFTGAVWVAVALLLSQPPDVQWAGLTGAGVVLLVSEAGVLAMTPWRARPASMWMTLWLAGMVVRMLAVPALTFLLYFAAPLNAMALTVAVALAYLIVLLTETVTLARHVGRGTSVGIPDIEA